MRSMQRRLYSSLNRRPRRTSGTAQPEVRSRFGSPSAYEKEQISVATLLSRLKQCALKGDLSGGMALHSIATRAGFHRNVYVANALVSMYSKCREMALAQEVFDQVADIRNVVLWNTLILGYVANGQSSMALRLFEAVDCERTSFTIVAGLRALSRLAAERELDKRSCLEKGLAIHEQAKKLGVDAIIFVTNALVEMYSLCGSMQTARTVFDSVTNRDVVLWTTLIHGYVEAGEFLQALNMFASMDCEPDQFAFVAALKACTGVLSENLHDREWCLEKGVEIHHRAKAGMLHQDMFVATGLLEMYSKCGDMRLAREAFNTMAHRNVVAWNSLILGYVENGESRRALEVYRTMECEPDTFTFVAALKACTFLVEEDKEWCLKIGIDIHERARKLGVESDLFVGSNLVEFYRRSGDMSQAQAVFDAMKVRDVVVWTSLILGYVENGESKLALELFDRMDCEPSSVTFVAALKACSGLASERNQAGKQSYLEKGMTLHEQARARGLETDAFVASNLVSMYSKCGSLQQARAVFDTMNIRGAVLWNALLASYVENGESDLTLDLFRSMDCEPTHLTYVAVIKACAALGALAFGKQIHADVCRRGLDGIQIVANSLVHFYGKCSKMATAEEIFHTMVTTREVACWNSLMAGYSSMGRMSEVFRLVKMMQESGVGQDGITFVLVLAACSHSGLVEEGKRWLDSMVHYGVEPSLEHYTCMVDMLGRANRLEEALSLISNMPREADVVAWTALLGSCKNLANVEVGKAAFDALVKYKDKDHRGVAYVLMSDIFMKLGMVHDHEAQRTENERRMSEV